MQRRNEPLRPPEADPRYQSQPGNPREVHDPLECAALVVRDYRRLYALGVHGLLLRPFSIIHQVSEPDYLFAIRGDPE